MTPFGRLVYLVVGSIGSIDRIDRSCRLSHVPLTNITHCPNDTHSDVAGHVPGASSRRAGAPHPRLARDRAPQQVSETFSKIINSGTMLLDSDGQLKPWRMLGDLLRRNSRRCPPLAQGRGVLFAPPPSGGRGWLVVRADPYSPPSSDSSLRQSPIVNGA